MMLYYLNCMSSTSSYLKYLLSEKELGKERSFLNMPHISISVSSLLVPFSLSKASYPKPTFIIQILNVLYRLVHVVCLHEAFPLTKKKKKGWDLGVFSDGSILLCSTDVCQVHYTQ